MYLIYNNDFSVRYKCEASSNGNSITIKFDDDVFADTTGFKLYTDDGRLLGDYSAYENIIAADSCSYTFASGSTNGSVSIPDKQPTTREQLESAQNEINELKEQLNITNAALEELIVQLFTDQEETDEQVDSNANN